MPESEYPIRTKGICGRLNGAVKEMLVLMSIEDIETMIIGLVA